MTREDRLEALGQFLCGRDLERDPGVPDLGLPADEALGHRRGRREERAGDLLGREPADLPERERRPAPSRSIAGWQQAKMSRRRSSSISSRCPRRVRVGDLREPPGELRLQGVEAAAAPKRVDRLESPRGDEPRPRIVRDAVFGPALDGDRKRLVERFFGQVEVAHEPDQGGEDAARLGAIDLLDQGVDVCRA